MSSNVWAAELSDAGDVRVSERPAGTPTSTGLLRLLASELVGADGGLDVIYGWLAAVSDHLGVPEVVLVIEEQSVGRQVFRNRPGLLRGDRVERLVVHAGPGLYAHPPVRFEPEEVSVALRLCGMAFELDVNRGQSVSDTLTGLQNRRGYEVAIAEAVDNAGRYGWPFALVLLDLDDFKRINDRYGHAVGDAVLERFGHDVGTELRRGDVGARLGGDEFGLILRGADLAAVESLLGRIRNRSLTAGHRREVDFSWGWAACPADSADADELYRLADARLYADKERTGGA